MSLQALSDYRSNLFCRPRINSQLHLYKILDICCGAGGYSLGFKEAGFNIIGGIDKWEGCKATYELNFPGSQFIQADITTLQFEVKGEKLWLSDGINEWLLSLPDIIIGSPPCNEVSLANPNREPEKVMICVNPYLDIVRAVNPRYWVMENVEGVKPFIDPLNIKSAIYDAADFGAPQYRQRCIAGKYPPPQVTHGTGLRTKKRVSKRRVKAAKTMASTLDGKVLPKHITAWNAIKDLLWIIEKQIPVEIPNLDALDSSQESMRYKLFDCTFGMQARQKYFDLNAPFPTITDMHGDSLIVPRVLELSDRFLNNNSYSPSYNGCMWPFRTITTVAHYILMKDQQTGGKIQLRRLSMRELARGQSFPDSFRFMGPLKDVATQIGNAVPPALSYALAKSIAARIF